MMTQEEHCFLQGDVRHRIVSEKHFFFLFSGAAVSSFCSFILVLRRERLFGIWQHDRLTLPPGKYKIFILRPCASGALDSLTASGTEGTCPQLLWVSLHRAALCMLAAPWTSQQERNETTCKNQYPATHPSIASNSDSDQKQESEKACKATHFPFILPASTVHVFRIFPSLLPLTLVYVTAVSEFAQFV